MKVLAALGLMVAGLVVGTASVAVHDTWWGLPLGLLSTCLVAYALPRRWWARPPFGLGWVAVVGYVVVPRAQGGYLISGDLNGYALLGFAVVLLVGSLVTGRPSRRVATGSAGGAS